jgi:hypothetical protein
MPLRLADVRAVRAIISKAGVHEGAHRDRIGRSNESANAIGTTPASNVLPMNQRN